MVIQGDFLGPCNVFKKLEHGSFIAGCLSTLGWTVAPDAVHFDGNANMQ